MLIVKRLKQWLNQFLVNCIEFIPVPSDETLRRTKQSTDPLASISKAERTKLFAKAAKIEERSGGE